MNKVSELKRLVAYDPETGLFTWRVSRGGSAIAGTIAGTRHSKGYVELNVGGRRWLAHRLAWIFMHGEIPSGLLLDHRNRDKSDNRITNLRLCTPSQSVVNRSGYSKKGLPKNIEVTGAGNYFCRLAIDGKRVSGPVRTSLEAAVRDRARLAQEHQGAFATP